MRKIIRSCSRQCGYMVSFSSNLAGLDDQSLPFIRISRTIDLSIAEIKLFKGELFVDYDDTERNPSDACVFCEIAKGTVPASMVFADAHVLAFLSLEQPNPYKVLIITREHVATLYDLTDEQAAQIFQVTVRIARLIRAVSGCEGLNVVQSNGTVGQQDVFHFHVHLVPRIAGDTQQGRIVLDWDNTPRERRELDRLAADLRLQLQSQSE